MTATVLQIEPKKVSAKEAIELYANHLISESWCFDASRTPMVAFNALSSVNASPEYFNINFPKWAKSSGIRVKEDEYVKFLTLLDRGLKTRLTPIFGTSLKPTPERFFKSHKGVMMANTFIPYNPAIEGEFVMPEILEEYLSRVFMNEQDRKHVTQFMADTIQNPLRRPQWSVVLTGEQGTGKSSLYTILKLALGGNHCTDPDEYTSSFKEFSEVFPNHIVVCFDDADNNSRGAYGKLKPAITCSTQLVAIKGQQQPINREVYTRIFVCSNKTAPLKIEAGDRRLYCAERSVHRISKEESEEFFEGFIDWLALPTTPAILYHWLKTLDLNDFKAGKTISTDTHKAMIDASESVMHQLIGEFVESGSVFIEQMLTHHLIENGIDRIDLEKMKSSLGDLGYVRKRRVVEGCGKTQLPVWQPCAKRARAITEEEAESICKARNSNF